MGFLALIASPPAQEGAGAAPGQGGEQALVAALAEQGIRLDLAHRAVVIPAEVLVREELLEYLLVGPRGAMHESLFLTEVSPSALNAALLALGVTPGTNARWKEDPSGRVPGDRSDERQGFEILPPEGDGFLIYAAWRDGEERHLYRVEDLVSNLAAGRSLRRHRFVYLGSRFAPPRRGQPEAFLAEVEGNLINLTFFFSGTTLLTAALPECIEQTIWAPNYWLVPPRGAPLLLVLARDPLETWPAEWDAALPDVAPAWEAAADDGR